MEMMKMVMAEIQVVILSLDLLVKVVILHIMTHAISVLELEDM